MSPEHEERFQRIMSDYMQRAGGDYAELLRRGQVVSPPGVEVEACRKRYPRPSSGGQAPGGHDPRRRGRDRRHAPRGHRRKVRAELERAGRLRGLAAQAREHAHQLGPWLRQDDESIAFCTRCTAHVYVRTSAPWVVDEAGLEESCERLDDLD